MEKHYELFLSFSKDFLSFASAVTLATVPIVSSIIGWLLGKKKSLWWIVLFPMSGYLVIILLLFKMYHNLFGRISGNEAQQFIHDDWSTYCIFSFETVILILLALVTLGLAVTIFYALKGPNFS